MGRISQDIIKKDGYKISALDIENTLLESPLVAEACVLSIPEIKHGEDIGAIIALKQHIHNPNSYSSNSTPYDNADIVTKAIDNAKAQE